MKYSGMTSKEIRDKLSLDEKIGQMVMFDFRKWADRGEKTSKDNLKLSDEVVGLIRKYKLGNIILFAENSDNIEQLVTLNHDLQNAVETGIPMFIGIDQEGGRIVRLADGCSMPGNMAISATDDPANAYSAGYITGKELAALGINVDFAPTLDINNNPRNPIINLRSFSSDPQRTAKYGVEMTKGFHAAGVACSAKHFPGHGNTDVDSHTGLPCINSTYEEMKKMELVPFIAASNEADIDMFMTTHIQFPKVETTTHISKQNGDTICLPATLSKKFLTDIVRDELGYKGIIITDSMMMQGVSSHFGPELANKLAINAGVDILLMCAAIRSLDDEGKLAAVLNGIKSAIESGEIPMKRIDESVERILSLKIKMGMFEDKKELSLKEKIENAKNILGCEEHRAIERKMASEGVTMLKNDGAIPLVPKENEKVLYVAAYPNKKNSYDFALKRLRLEGKLGEFESDYCFYERKTALDDESKAKIDESDHVIIVTEAEAGMSKEKWQVAFPFASCEYAKAKGKKVIVISAFLPFDTVYYSNADAILVCYCQKGMPYQAVENINTRKAYGVNIPAAIEGVFGAYEIRGVLPIEIPYIGDDGTYDCEKIIYPFGYGLK